MEESQEMLDLSRGSGEGHSDKVVRYLQRGDEVAFALLETEVIAEGASAKPEQAGVGPFGLV